MLFFALIFFCFFVFFFFQAEDGIRDRNVTGVQTCALPISGGMFNILAPSVQSMFLLGASGAAPIFGYGRWWTVLSAGWLHGSLLHIVFNMMRSEERRVGKECRSRWWPDH